MSQGVQIRSVVDVLALEVFDRWCMSLLAYSLITTDLLSCEYVMEVDGYIVYTRLLVHNPEDSRDYMRVKEIVPILSILWRPYSIRTRSRLSLANSDDP